MTALYRHWRLNVQPSCTGEGYFADAGEGEDDLAGGYIRSDGLFLATEAEAMAYLRSQVDIVISREDDEAEAEALNLCPCGEPNDDGEGWDGMCGNCADRAEK